ncbi:6-phosphogluconolactonase [Symbiodinium microadriaticum]|uniref:6-phosphogluconolactonase n=1 Tax=Symbiodinium microadriaticum TaxID=2951 RepID=A0A1Q9EWN7_SYMMI|nr:6-phosphogluconolactonase [Symbiodinium microadriaticum]
MPPKSKPKKDQVLKRPAQAQAKKRPAAKSVASQAQYVLVSSYTEKHGHVFSPRINEAKGITVFQRTPGTADEFGSLTPVWSCTDFPSPTYMCANRARTRIYTVSEVGSDATVSAYAFDASSGKMKLLNSVETGGAVACHVSLSRNERILAVANYMGSVGLFRLQADGRLVERTFLQEHERLGVGVNRERQEGPHPHMALFDAQSKHVLVPDLGLDRVVVYGTDVAGRLKAKSHLALPPGSGPRHMAFHPGGRLAYVLNELLSTVVPCHWDAKTTSLTAIGEPRDGRFVYVSNRGHCSITVFRVLEDGLLERSSSAFTGPGVCDEEREVAWPPRDCPRDFDSSGGLF